MPVRGSRHPVRVYVEVARRRSFAAAIDWPGWVRSGRTEADALRSLLACAPRYAAAVGPAAGFVPPRATSALTVEERLDGGTATEFGVPGEIPSADHRSLDTGELERQITLLRCAWEALDEAADEARNTQLRRGPRGGGRDLDKIIGHVFDAESSYVARLGARYRGDAYDAAALRDAAVLAIGATARNEPLEHASRVKKRWPPRYFVRRAAWHALDHAWEIEDRRVDRGTRGDA